MKIINPLFNTPENAKKPVDINVKASELSLFAGINDKAPISPVSGHPMQLVELGLYNNHRAIKCWVNADDRIVIPARQE